MVVDGRFFVMAFWLQYKACYAVFDLAFSNNLRFRFKLRQSCNNNRQGTKEKKIKDRDKDRYIALVCAISTTVQAAVRSLPVPDLAVPKPRAQRLRLQIRDSDPNDHGSIHIYILHALLLILLERITSSLCEIKQFLLVFGVLHHHHVCFQNHV